MKIVKFRFIASLLCSTAVIYIAGNLKPMCNFCGRERGWPLTYYREAGLVGDAVWLRLGLMADAAAATGFAMLATLLWCLLAQVFKVPSDESPGGMR